MKIMVSGALNDKGQTGDHDVVKFRHFAETLARQIVEQGHELRCGNCTSLDELIISAAYDAANSKGLNGDRVVVSYVQKNRRPRLPRGRVNTSMSRDWSSIVGRQPFVPEPVEQADVLILIGGCNEDGSEVFVAANWARHTRKLILPVATFGMDAEEIYEDCTREGEYFSVELDEFQELTRSSSVLESEESIRDYARVVISLAEKMALSREVFVVMPFDQTEQFRDYFASVQETCKEVGLEAVRADTTSDSTRQIMDKVHERIENCNFVIAELSGERPNVYYEVGFARGWDKEVILTAKGGVKVHFDLYGLERIVWDDNVDLKARIRPILARFARSFGLRPT